MGEIRQKPPLCAELERAPSPASGAAEACVRMSDAAVSLKSVMRNWVVPTQTWPEPPNHAISTPNLRDGEFWAWIAEFTVVYGMASFGRNGARGKPGTPLRPPGAKTEKPPEVQPATPAPAPLSNDRSLYGFFEDLRTVGVGAKSFEQRIAALAFALRAIAKRPMHRELRSTAQSELSYAGTGQSTPSLHWINTEAGTLPMVESSIATTHGSSTITLRVFDPSGNREIFSHVVDVARPRAPVPQEELRYVTEVVKIGVREAQEQLRTGIANPKQVKRFWIDELNNPFGTTH